MLRAELESWAVCEPLTAFLSASLWCAFSCIAFAPVLRQVRLRMAIIMLLFVIWHADLQLQIKTQAKY